MMNIEIKKKYECNKCGKSFSGKGDLDRHIKRLKPCIKEEQEQYNKTKRTCSLCDKQFSRVESMKTHMLICKTKKINGNIDNTVITNQMLEEIKEELLKNMKVEMFDHVKKISEEKNAIIDELKHTITTLQTKQGITTISGKKNTVVNGNNTNNIQQNIHNEIKILAYGKEDLSFITDDVYKVLLNKGFKSVQNLVEYIHMNDNKPENQNIYISNMRDNYVLIFDGIDWRLKERDDILQEMVENKTDILTDKFEELIKTLDESTIKKFKRFIDEKDEDNVADQIKKDLKLILYNKKIIKEPPTKLITNTNKENIIHEHPKPPVEIEDIDKSKDDIIITTYRKRRSTIK